MIKVTYYYSACVSIESQDTRVICDPWFTDGAYDGSWFQYPKLKDPLEKLGKADFIYISHIHPDHYDPVFIKTYLAKYPEARVLIADFQQNFLAKKMKSEGIEFSIIRELRIGDTNVRIFPNELSSADVDSALVLQAGGHSVVNMNDNLYNEEQLNAIVEYCPLGIQIALMGYTGAGPYPQTYYRDTDILMEKAQQKKLQFFERYLRMKNFIKPHTVVPFAGKYILGGKLADMNPYRGVADAVEVLEIDSDAVVLDDGGDSWIDTKDFKASSVRTKPYDVDDMQVYWNSLKDAKMTYELWFNIPLEKIPFERTLGKAYLNAHRKSECQSDYFFCVKLWNGRWFVMNAGKDNSSCSFVDGVDNFQPRSEVEIDPQYLWGLVTGVFHWNNAEVGSQYRTTRVPDIFRREAQSFLNFFHL